MNQYFVCTKLVELSDKERVAIIERLCKSVEHANLPIKFTFKHSAKNDEDTEHFAKETLMLYFSCREESFVNLYGSVIDISGITFHIQKCFGFVKTIEHKCKFNDKPIYKVFITVNGTEKPFCEEERKITLKDNFQMCDDIEDISLLTALYDFNRFLAYI